MKRMAVEISGIVQGVGFRPFVYQLAKARCLAGWVLNDSQGVKIQAEGEEAALQDFLRALKEELPPLARMDEMKVSYLPVKGESSFTIAESRQVQASAPWVAPDTALCQACRQEMHSPEDRRYGYPFINCTNCGPRYSIVRQTPYDRKYTTMASFVQCPVCQQEYDDPASRRFHAQPNACPVCGPQYQLLDAQGRVVEGEVFAMTRKLIYQGYIVAVKGIGGYHLACCARQETAVAKLRKRKGREAKPFAVMCATLQEAEEFCQLSAEERQLLTSPARPIVLLQKRPDKELALSIAPGNGYFGVMLPYAPVHELLLQSGDIWVMTSGNSSEEPIVYQDEEAKEKLSGLADFFLVHNREIERPVDDSVARVSLGHSTLLRRSRGLAPVPVLLPERLPPLLAVGGQVKNAFCLTKEKLAFVSHHIGDLDSLKTYRYFLRELERYQQLFAVKPEAVVHDLHPEYAATQYATGLSLPSVGVQHHHAHIAGVMAEHQVTGPVLGLAFDGTGYGTDGCLWGGEFLICEYETFTRAAHFSYLPLPGGEKAIKEPWRLALWVLYNKEREDLFNLPLPFLQQLPSSWPLLMQAAEQGLNSPLTSSAGRVFDIAAVLLGYQGAVSYEGQAAIELEQLACQAVGQGFRLPYTIRETPMPQLDFSLTFQALAENLAKGMAPAILAEAFHTTVAHAVCQMTLRISRETGLQKVALSGGVWQNQNLLTKVVRMLQRSLVKIYVHRQLPANDGGLAYGQAVVGGRRLVKGMDK